MKNNFYHVFHQIPTWKKCVYVLLSIICAIVAVYILKLILVGFAVTSVTFYTVTTEISVAYGKRHFERLIMNIEYVLYFVAFCLFMVVFYFREKRQYLKKYFHQILDEVKFIDNVNLNHEIKVLPNTELGELAEEINSIVKKLKESIEEERRIEQTKKDLITSVSHDLRTPLTSIIGYISFIQQDKYRDEIELRYYIEIVHDKVLRLNHLMNDLFEYTRFQNKGISLSKAPINITEMLNQLIVQFRFEIKDANMEFRQSIYSSKLMVLADGEKLVRVFENLIVNAIKYGSDGYYLDIIASEENGLVEIEFTNYGKEIPPSDLHHIFDRFYRVEKSRSTNRGGSGLGLAIAKSIIELHEGTISVYSDVERTTFTIKLKSMKEETSR
ncbi:sensor histidine kinase [Priestia taiwanensis]|uniref:histidine kinase n=1 Tax=Priestia taiwanensis TaxID=1347902 RepID=A0A917AR17_9BACI|nr:HAMP domain-containing sensor histidine kinase [Priestia taiwanensis]MBM7363126.1 signal transduction histidine kinase [Priestia taiwanensis]GGE67900.1 two-component sensor histidine kinase [Priestia taiwanensis]